MKTILNHVLFAFVSAFTSPILAAGKAALQRIVFFRARRRPRRTKENLMATSTRRRYLVRWALAAAFLALMHPAASAQDVPFAFLIKDGWKTLNTSVSTRLDQGLVSLHTTGTLHEVVGGQKGSVVGTAFVQAFTRSVPDPTFASILPLGGLITLDFGTFQGHLALIDTPTGIQTTVAVIDASGAVDTRITGAWVFGNGAAVGGGTADDMTVGVLVHIGQPSDPIPLLLDIPPYFPLVPFANDTLFARMGPDYFIGGAVCLGSGYGEAQGPLRVYTFCDDFGLGAEFDSALLVMHTEGSSYAVLACSHLFNQPLPGGGAIDALVSRCTVSGTGVLSRLTGGATGLSITSLSHHVIPLTLHFAP